MSCLAGFLLGTRQTLLETTDGGKTWKARDIQAAQVSRAELQKFLLDLPSSDIMILKSLLEGILRRLHANRCTRNDS